MGKLSITRGPEVFGFVEEIFFYNVLPGYKIINYIFQKYNMYARNTFKTSTKDTDALPTARLPSSS
jgi:hypothetical protein